MATPVRRTLDFLNIARLINVPDAVDPQEPVTLAQLQAAVEGLAWKDNARAASTANVNIASPGATMDGVTLATSDRVLLKDQTDAAENGLYIWNGAATPLTRAPDASTFDSLESAVVTVDEGTANGSATYRQTQVNGTIDIDDVIWAAFGTIVPLASETTAGRAEEATQAEVDAGTLDGPYFVSPEKLENWSGRKLVYTVTLGDGSANSIVITHNLNTRGVIAQVYESAGSYREVVCEVQRTSVNSVTLLFDAAPTSGELTVIIIA